MAYRVVTGLIEYLTGLLKDEALAGVEDSVNSFIAELRFINVFLKKFEGKRNDEIVREVVRRIRDVAYKAEDEIDDYILKVAEHRKKSVIGRILHTPSLAMMLRDVGKEIVGIKRRIEEISERVEATVNAFEETALHTYRREVEQDDVVGFYDYSLGLVKQLTEGDPKLDVVSIIGMGGSGKTTLARKIYNSLRDERHFECHVWVYVSQDFRLMQLLLEIVKELNMACEGNSVNELKKELFKYLNGKRYLIVMDDVWRAEVWDEVKSFFPNCFNGSRILITSRNRKVALHASDTLPYILPLLDEDDSWKLFSKMVFRKRICPPELETLGRQIATGCKGLPLSIVVFAGLLAKKEKSFRTWSKYVDHVTSFLTHEEDTAMCQKVLSLSYMDLPRFLKQCFLYFGMYPEDFEIPVRRLIHLWIAEGLIQHIDDRSPEDVAESNLEKLIDRSLIQVASRRTDGGVRTCRIHDLLREFCIKESEKEMFLEVLSGNHLRTSKSRRLSIQGSARQYISASAVGPINARSLFFLGEYTYSFDANHWAWVLEKFRLLRVLNFGRVNLYSIPRSIAKLIHLRYLAIESAALRAIPASIDNLLNLETLDMRGTFLECLPKGIWKLRRLKNLYMSGPVSFPEDLDPDVTALENLHVLSTVSVNPQTLSPSVMAKLPNVRKLGIWSDESNSGAVDVLECLHLLCHLQRVKVINWSECPLRNLFPSTINKITLRQVSLEDGGGMSELGKLPSLRILKLQSCLLSSKLDVFPGTFPQLEVLKLENLMIKEWKQGRQAMPFLKHLFIKKCIELTILPLEVQRSTALQYVEVVCSNPELAKMVEELRIQVGFRLLVDPPLDADFYKKAAALNIY